MRPAANALLAALVFMLLLAGCSGLKSWSTDFHTVRSGETVFSIARRYDLDTRDLIRWNQLGDGTLIYSGQKLRLRPPAASAAVARAAPSIPVLPPPIWSWPVDGPVLAFYGSSARTRAGMRLGGSKDSPVKAAAAGEVVYAGDDLPHYGLLLIIKHNDSWLSAYGFNSSLNVREGDRVLAGAQVATIGADARGRSLLHFEIRRAGQPVDPLGHLPKRN